jgi:hypothetical protein
MKLTGEIIAALLKRAWPNKMGLPLLIGCSLNGNEFPVTLMNEGHGS